MLGFVAEMENRVREWVTSSDLHFSAAGSGLCATGVRPRMEIIDKNEAKFGRGGARMCVTQRLLFFRGRSERGIKNMRQGKKNGGWKSWKGKP